MAVNNMHNMATLMTRLEAVVSRLEDIASSSGGFSQPVFSQPAPPQPVPSQPSLIQDQSVASFASAVTIVDEPIPKSIKDFDALIAGPVAEFVDLSNLIGWPVTKQAQCVLRGFKEQRNFLLVTTKAKKPERSGPESLVYQRLLKSIEDSATAVTDIQQSNRDSPVFEQLSAVSDGIVVLAWHTMVNRPFHHVETTFEAVQYFGNRVIMQHKESDPKQANLIRAYYQIFRGLLQYTKDHFPQGIPWNRTGRPIHEVVATTKFI